MPPRQTPLRWTRTPNPPPRREASSSDSRTQRSRRPGSGSATTVSACHKHSLSVDSNEQLHCLSALGQQASPQRGLDSARLALGVRESGKGSHGRRKDNQLGPSWTPRAPSSGQTTTGLGLLLPASGWAGADGVASVVRGSARSNFPQRRERHASALDAGHIATYKSNWVLPLTRGMDTTKGV